MAELRQSANNVEIIGTVKKVELEEKKSIKTGKDMILGSVIMEVKEAEKVHNIKVKLFSMKMNKQGQVSGLFKGYKTVKDEWKAGDRARITGSIGLQEYYSQAGQLVTFNEVKGLFCNRLDGEDANQIDKAIATVELVVEGMTSELDGDGIPTGNLEVDAFTVDYGSKIIPIENLIIGQALGDQFQNMYFPGTTGRITFKINNFATVVKEEAPAQSAGFGAAERVEENVVSNYTNNFEIIGGDLPYADGVNEYTPVEIEQAHKTRELALQELQQNATAAPTPTTGFGSASNSTTSQDDLTKAFTSGNDAAADPSTFDDETPAF